MSALEIVANEVFDVEANASQDLGVLSSLAADLFAGLDDLLAVIAGGTNPELPSTEYILPLVARTWRDVKDESPQRRLPEASEHLRRLTDWLAATDLLRLSASAPLNKQLVDIYDAIQHRIPSKDFVAISYPDQGTQGEAYQRSKRRLEQLQGAVETVSARRIPCHSKLATWEPRSVERCSFLAFGQMCVSRGG